MIIQNLAEGFAYGLQLSTLCFITCGPIYTSYFLQQRSSWVQSLLTFLQISGARFIAYILFGIAAGFIGREIGDFNRSWFTAISYMLCTIVLINTTFNRHNKDKGCKVKKWNKYIENPFILGLVTGINFCPGFLIAITRAIDLSGPLSGAVLFTAFFFGSNAILFPLFIFGILGNFDLLKRNNKLFKTISIVSTVAVSIFCVYRAYESIQKLVYEKVTLEREFEEKTLVTVFDSTDAYILSADTSSFVYLKERLKMKRPGNISFITNMESIPDNGYIFVDWEWPKFSKMDYESLKLPGRFVIILPEPKIDSAYGDKYADRLITFLDLYYFKLDTLHGSIFNMASSQVSARFNRADSARGKR